jgi:glutamate N-acetyltransferase/amino-acid N-acetyltransferase
MATMLAFITTDAAVPPACSPAQRTVASTFNTIDVDGETSPNDLVVCFANGLKESPSPRVRAWPSSKGCCIGL